MLQVRFLLVLLALAALLAAGCGGDEEEDGVGTGTDTAAETQPAPTQPAAPTSTESENSSDGDDCVDSFNTNASGAVKELAARSGDASQDALAGVYGGEPFKAQIEEEAAQDGRLEVQPGDCVVLQRVDDATRYVLVQSSVGQGVEAWHAITVTGHPLESGSAGSLDDEVRVRVEGTDGNARLDAAPDSSDPPDDGSD